MMVIVDVRPGSPTCGGQLAVDFRLIIGGRCLSPSYLLVYQMLVHLTDVKYLMNAAYARTCLRGLKHDDPELAIRWPLPVSVSSPKDQKWPDFGADRI
jgi:dTDP-4-dehydrorhamnose 3,5-epimerase